MAINLITPCARRIAPALMLPFVLIAPAAAQQATQAQRNAIRQACPADYQAHCANVPAAGTGGVCLSAAQCGEPLAGLSAGGESGQRGPGPACRFLGECCAGGVGTAIRRVGAIRPRR